MQRMIQKWHNKDYFKQIEAIYFIESNQFEAIVKNIMGYL